MRRSLSMETLQILPEEAKMAASLLRLTLSDNLENCLESDFQSYISTHSQFPYHRAVPVTTIRPESDPILIKGSTNITKTTSHFSLTTAQQRRERRRCNSSPPGMSNDVVEISRSTAAADHLSQSAPAESQGFFQRFFPSFLRRKVSTEENTALIVVTPAKPPTVFREQKTAEKIEIHGSGRFVGQVVRSDRDKMDSLIFMSMR